MTIVILLSSIGKKNITSFVIKTRAYLEGHDSDEKYNRGPGTHISFKYRKYGSQPLGMNDAIESTTKLCITCIIFIYYTKKEKKN